MKLIFTLQLSNWAYLMASLNTFIDAITTSVTMIEIFFSTYSTYTTPLAMILLFAGIVIKQAALKTRIFTKLSIALYTLFRHLKSFNNKSRLLLLSASPNSHVVLLLEQCPSICIFKNLFGVFSKGAIFD